MLALGTLAPCSALADAGTGALAGPGPSAWLTADGHPATAARQAVALLADASSHGLTAADYGADALRLALQRLDGEQTADRHAAAQPPTPAATRLAMALDAAMQRYLIDLHRGRVDPQQLQQRYAVARPTTFNPATVLQQALASGQLDAAVVAAAPTLPQYPLLREALARYRALDRHAAWRQPLPPLPAQLASPRGRAATLSPGQAYAGAGRLAQRLLAVGDLPPGAWQAGVDARYDGALVDALRSFQRRHGLADDGVVGAATLAALQVPPAARAQQISLALERLRWTPVLQGPRMLLINIPEFVLRAYDVVDGQIQLRTQMKVIVGKALNTRTPLFNETLRFIEFSPYWNVPPSIARAETVPRLRRDPAYWNTEGFEFVAADGSVHTGLSGAGLDAVLAGQWRVRQRPGPRNALGDIKFVFPNRDNIYLHHTPATALFARTRRDFSHGCIRVEDPVALASFVLQGQRSGGPWTDERIRAAMAQGRSSTLRLDATLPVLITYGTTLVLDGQLHFFDDLYGQDRVLDAALRQHRPALPAPD